MMIEDVLAIGVHGTMNRQIEVIFLVGTGIA
jgi:hypothetical protein